MIVLYGLKNCDGCRQAMRLLETAGIDNGSGLTVGFGPAILQGLTKCPG